MKKSFTLISLALSLIVSFGVQAASNNSAFQLRPSATELKVANTVANKAQMPLGEAKQGASMSKAKSTDTHTWVSRGNVVYTDDFFASIFSGLGNESWEVEIFEAEDAPGFYRMQNPYAVTGSYYRSYYSSRNNPSSYLYIHTEYGDDCVFVENLNTGCTLNSSYGYVNMLCRAFDYVDYYDGQLTPQQLKELLPGAGEDDLFGTFEDGRISFPANSFLLSMSKYNSGQWTFYGNSNGKFSIAFPGAKDYSLDILPTQGCIVDGKIPVKFTVGADVAAVKALCVVGDYSGETSDPDFLADAVELSQNINPVSGVYELDALCEDNDPGFYTIFAMSFDANGKMMGSAISYCFNVVNDAENWKSIGVGQFTDGIVANGLYTFNGVTDFTWEVEVEENVNTPGYYRIVNPYENAIFSSLMAEMNCEHDHYIYIHAEDPDKVYVEEGPVGCNLQGNGDIILSWIGYWSNSPSYGSLEDGVITFAAKCLLVDEMSYPTQQGYYAGETILVLPEPVEETITIYFDNKDSKYVMPHVHYSLDGVNFEEPILMEKLEGVESIADEDVEPAQPEIWAAKISADATHVKFTDGADGTSDDIFEAEDGKTYVGKTNGVSSIFGSTIAPVEYFNLQGIRIDRPAKGQIVIRRQGNNVKTVIVK